MILNCQVQVNGMGNWSLCKVFIKALNWLWFQERDEVNSKVFTNNVRSRFINKSIFSSISIYKSFDSVSLVVVKQGARCNQRFWGKWIVCQTWRRWNQQQISHRDFSEGYLFFDNSVMSSSWIRAAFRAWASLLFEQITNIYSICLHRKHFPWAYSCSCSAAVVFVMILRKEFNQVTGTASTAARVRHVDVMLQEVFVESLNLLMLKEDSFWSFCRWRYNECWALSVHCKYALREVISSNSASHRVKEFWRWQINLFFKSFIKVCSSYRSTLVIWANFE